MRGRTRTWMYWNRRKFFEGEFQQRSTAGLVWPLFFLLLFFFPVFVENCVIFSSASTISKGDYEFCSRFCKCLIFFVLHSVVYFYLFTFYIYESIYCARRIYSSFLRNCLLFFPHFILFLRIILSLIHLSHSSFFSFSLISFFTACTEFYIIYIFVTTEQAFFIRLRFSFLRSFINFVWTHESLPLEGRRGDLL